jgi:hypothetical protein
VGERARTLSGSVLAMLAASTITLSAYYLAVAKNAPSPKAAKTTKSETLVYLYKPGPAVARHRWFTVPGSAEKFCGIADGTMADGKSFGAPVPCSSKDLQEDRQHR